MSVISVKIHISSKETPTVPPMDTIFRRLTDQTIKKQGPCYTSMSRNTSECFFGSASHPYPCRMSRFKDNRVESDPID